MKRKAPVVPFRVIVNPQPPATLSPFMVKAASLERERPTAAGVIERLIDDLLAEVRRKGGAQ